jgi:hypothetical protein
LQAESICNRSKGGKKEVLGGRKKFYIGEVLKTQKNAFFFK